MLPGRRQAARVTITLPGLASNQLQCQSHMKSVRVSSTSPSPMECLPHILSQIPPYSLYSALFCFLPGPYGRIGCYLGNTHLVICLPLTNQSQQAWLCTVLILKVKWWSLLLFTYGEASTPSLPQPAPYNLNQGSGPLLTVVWIII